MFKIFFSTSVADYIKSVLLNYTTRVFLGGALVSTSAWLVSATTLRPLTASAVAPADRSIAAAIHAHASAGALEAMAWVSRLHSTAGILVMSAIAAAWLAQRGYRAVLPVLLASVPGGLLLNVLVKHAVQRVRPDSAYATERLTTFSFPSGHTAGATVLYGFLVAMLWPLCRSPLARAALVAAAAALVALVAASRIMLGLHYASDCAAAVAEGLLWLAICLATLHRAQRS